MKTKNQEFLEEINKAFARSDSEFILQHITDNIKWTVQGDFAIEGKKAFIRKLKKMESPEPFELKISNIITHGKSAAVDGYMKTPGGKTFAFCDIYQFKGHKNPLIKEINSYVIEIEK